MHVIDTNSPSYRWHSPVSILDSGAVEKMRVYHSAVEDRRGTLHLLFCRLMACCSMRLHTLSSVYLLTWPLDGRNLFLIDVLDFVRSRLLFASVLSASMCLRESRIKWRSGLGFDDGAPLQFVIQ